MTIAALWFLIVLCPLACLWLLCSPSNPPDFGPDIRKMTQGLEREMIEYERLVSAIRKATKT